MESILFFLVGTVVRLIDPVTLVMAAICAAVAASCRARELRWLVIIVGAGLITAAMAALSLHVAALDGNARYRFPALEFAVASFIQIALICWGILKWRAKRAAI